MKRYNITVREIWDVTRQVEAEDSFNANDNYLEGSEIKRVRIGPDHCEDFNTTEEIQVKNEMDIEQFKKEVLALVSEDALPMVDGLTKEGFANGWTPAEVAAQCEADV